MPNQYHAPIFIYPSNAHQLDVTPLKLERIACQIRDECIVHESLGMSKYLEVIVRMVRDKTDYLSSVNVAKDKNAGD